MTGGITGLINGVKKSLSLGGHSTGKGYSSNDSHDDDNSSYDSSGKDRDRSKSVGGHDSNEDYSDDEDEGEDGYKVGGYHRVKVGEVYNQR